MASNMRWHGEEVKREVHKGVAKNLDQAAQFWKRYAQLKLGRLTVSRAGEFLGMAGRSLKRGIEWQKVSQLIRRVGTNVTRKGFSYAKFWELHKTAPRPWMTRTNKETRNQLARIMGKKI